MFPITGKIGTVTRGGLRIYVAGPMVEKTKVRPDADSYRYQHFHDAQQQLEEAGFIVYNPATNHAGDREDPLYRMHTPEEWSEFTPEEYQAEYRRVMARDIRWILECDAVALLPGWRDSQGAMFEHHIAAFLGKRISNVRGFTEGEDGLVEGAEDFLPGSSDTARIRSGATKDKIDPDDALLVKYTGIDPRGVGLGEIHDPAHPGDCGYDLSVAHTTYVDPDAFAVVPCGLAVRLPARTWALVSARSSTFRKHRLFVTPSIIDGGYRGPISVGVWNTSDKTVEVRAGQRLAQLIVMPTITPPIMLVDRLPQSERGIDAFGSTGD